jgi:hypothetical protein
MMGVEEPETCWATQKRQVINLWNCCIWLVDLFEDFWTSELPFPRVLKFWFHCVYRTMSLLPYPVPNTCCAGYVARPTESSLASSSVIIAIPKCVFWRRVKLPYCFNNPSRWDDCGHWSAFPNVCHCMMYIFWINRTKVLWWFYYPAFKSLWVVSWCGHY